MTGQRAPGLPDGNAQPDGGERRLAGTNPFGDSKFTERNWDILDVLNAVAAEVGASQAQVALAWAVRRPGVASVLIGASRTDQFTGNLGALSIELSDDQQRRLDDASAPTLSYPTSLFTPAVNRMVFGGHDVASWP